MKTAAIAKLYEMQNNKPLREALKGIHDSLHDDVYDSEWVKAIEVELEEIDLNVPEVRRDIAKTIHESEKKSHSKSTPGEGRQISFEGLTPEWANNSGISIEGSDGGEGAYVKWIDAKTQHAFEYWRQRQENAADAADGAIRAGDLYQLTTEPGGLRGALRRRGIKGW